MVFSWNLLYAETVQFQYSGRLLYGWLPVVVQSVDKRMNDSSLTKYERLMLFQTLDNDSP